ncbi:MAG: EscU/YscU/HrcU family type III secretion system export apparatus switch protein, partial [Polyangiaceae bacterium]|nr:EscU/YscU/HrcU family type III secretion system export apparatus switch protein [Polyangiaceae bacterium]
VSSAYLQVGALFAPGRIAPRLDHLDPTKGFRRIFSKASVVELAKSFVVLAILVHIAWGALADGTTGIARAAALGPASLLEAAGALVLRVMLRTGVALLAIGIVDFFYQRYRHVQDQRMTKDEVKREHREADGDPQSKQQRARMHQEIVEHAAVEEVRLADVLVVNPTHYAVALSFDREGEQDAPEVRAKGVDHLARRMIEAARESGVPVLRDIPLAHALYALEVGEQIPEALYEATAAVLQAAWDEREGSNP